MGTPVAVVVVRTVRMFSPDLTPRVHPDLSDKPFGRLPLSVAFPVAQIVQQIPRAAVILSGQVASTFGLMRL